MPASATMNPFGGIGARWCRSMRRWRGQFRAERRHGAGDRDQDPNESGRPRHPDEVIRAGRGTGSWQDGRRWDGSRRIAAITESATLAVDARAKALQAAGEDVIGFGAGEPDFPTPAHIVEAAVAACRDPRNHRYSPTPGLPELREAIAHKTKRDSGFDVAAGQVLVTNGGKHAVYTAFQVLLDPGDEVLCPAPYWTTYPEAITLAGGVPVVVPTGEASGFRVTVEQLDAACTPRTKVLLFVSPSNPTGAVYPPEEVEAIGRWALERGIWVVTDEIYEHLTFGEHRFSSMPTLVPDLAERASSSTASPRPTR